MMINAIHSNNSVTQQSSAVAQAIKDAKPDLVSKAEMKSDNNAGQTSAGNSDSKQHSKGLDVSV
ncbi:MAG: hypothetical protein HQL70_10735 [Magnetococcales bacterium]|nr:hypothetical protein [Magnetococcales bacterium]